MQRDLRVFWSNMSSIVPVQENRRTAIVSFGVFLEPLEPRDILVWPGRQAMQLSMRAQLGTWVVSNQK